MDPLVVCRRLKDCEECLTRGCVWINETRWPCRTDLSDFDAHQAWSGQCPEYALSWKPTNLTVSQPSVTTDDNVAGIQSLYQACIAILLVLTALLIVTMIGRFSRRKAAPRVTDAEAAPALLTTSTTTTEADNRCGEYQRFL